MQTLVVSLRKNVRYFLPILFFLLGSFPSFSSSPYSSKAPAELRLAEQCLATNLDSSFYYATTFIQTRDEKTKKEDLAFAYYIAGSAEYLFGNLSYSDSLMQHALKTATEGNEEYLQGACHQFYGKILKVEKRFESSLFHLQKAKELFDKGDDPIKKIDIVIDIAEYYRAMANFSRAEEYLSMAEVMESKLEVKNEDLKANLLNRKAAVYDELGKVDEALELSRASLELSEKSGNLHYQASSHNEIGFIFWKKGDMKCFEHYNKAIGIWKKINYHYYKTSTQMNLAMAYLGQKDYIVAEKIIMEAMEESQKK